MRRRIAAYALAALLVPLPALALEAGGGLAAIDVGASLGSCGVAQQRIVCQIHVSYSSVEGAESYEVSVSAPDGSTVTQSGGGGGTTVFVPYRGSGSYSVQVVAYGAPPETAEEEDELTSGETGVGKEGEVKGDPNGPTKMDEAGKPAAGESHESESPAESEPPAPAVDPAVPPAEPPPAPAEPPAEPPAEAPDAEATAPACREGTEGEAATGAAAEEPCGEATADP